MSIGRNAVAAFFIAIAVFISCVGAYEINNHADMSQTSAERSTLSVNGNEKLFKLGLRRLDIADTKQTFPLDAGLGPIPYCFGSARPNPWAVVINNPANFPPQQDSTQSQPPWGTTTETKLTIAQMVRYGACFEDAEEPQARSLAHFYNPQDSGAGGSIGVIPTGPSSLDWMLKRNVSTGIAGKAGVNHYTWMDARNNFYYALTGRDLDPQWPITADVRREAAWGRTFQALGHIVHHLQDMGSPQHVRNDAHCNDTTLCTIVGQYKPSGYETYFENNFNVIKALAQSATAPTMFGLPREFWNMNTDNKSVTNPCASLES